MTFTQGTPLWRLFTYLVPVRRRFQVAFGMEPARSVEDAQQCGQAVAVYLARHCFAAAPTTSEREQGRRDVWLMIARFCHMSEEELTVLHARLTPEQRHQLWAPGPTFSNDDERKWYE